VARRTAGGVVTSNVTKREKKSPAGKAGSRGQEIRSRGEAVQRNGKKKSPPWLCNENTDLGNWPLRLSDPAPAQGEGGGGRNYDLILGEG